VQSLEKSFGVEGLIQLFFPDHMEMTYTVDSQKFWVLVCKPKALGIQ